MQSQVRFNRVPKKVPEKVWEALVQSCRARSGSTGFWRRFREALVQSQARFNRVPKKVPEKVWEALVQGQVKFNKASEEGSGEGLGGFGAEPGQGQQGSGEGSGEGLGGFGAEPGQVQQGSGEGLGGFGSQVKSNRVPKKVPEKVWEALVQSRVRFNRVPEKVPEKVWEALVQSQLRFNRVPETVPGRCGRLWCRARSSSTRFRRRSGTLLNLSWLSTKLSQTSQERC